MKTKKMSGAHFLVTFLETHVIYAVWRFRRLNRGALSSLNGYVTVTFVIQNPTKTNFTISSVNTNASWVTADWTKNAIVPGESGTITIKININGRQGTSINRSITAVLSNGEKLTMNIKGNVQ